MKVDGIDPALLNKIREQPRSEIQQPRQTETDARLKQREKTLGQLPTSLEEEGMFGKIEEELTKLNGAAEAFDVALRFKLHHSDRWMVQVFNLETDEVIKEIPPEKVLNVIAQIQNLIGILLDVRR